MRRTVLRVSAIFAVVAFAATSLCACTFKKQSGSAVSLSSAALSLAESASDVSRFDAKASAADSTGSKVSESTTAASQKNSVSRQSTTSKKTSTVSKKPATESTGNLSDTLFIGDSRTVGLMAYGGISSDFFATVGMSVYNIYSESVSVPSVGTVTLHGLLGQKQYRRVFLMLGINEIGYDTTTTANKYRALLDEIKGRQPNATIYVQANLHVGREKSNSDAVINNEALNRYNKKIAAFADGKRVVYLDANSLFDDSTGALSSERTPDGVHLYANDYVAWAKWIEKQCK
mgnify:CR=1 FL=1